MLHPVNLGALFKHFDLVDKLADVLKMPVNRRVTHVGNHVDNVQSLHHFGTNLPGVNLAPVVCLQILHDLIDHLFNHVGTDRSLLASLGNAVLKLVPVERLVATIALDHQQIGPLDLLVGREPIFTVQANPATPDARTMVYRSGVNDPIFDAFTFGATHPLEQ